MGLARKLPLENLWFASSTSYRNLKEVGRSMKVVGRFWIWDFSFSLFVFSLSLSGAKLKSRTRSASGSLFTFAAYPSRTSVGTKGRLLTFHF